MNVVRFFFQSKPNSFSFRNKLIRHGVVTNQLFNEKRGERLTVTTLLTLPRFFNTNRSRLLNMVEKLFLILKDKPDYTMPLLEVRTIFPSFERQKSLKKAMLTHLFRQIFETRVSITLCKFDYKQMPYYKGKNYEDFRNKDENNLFG